MTNPFAWSPGSEMRDELTLGQRVAILEQQVVLLIRLIDNLHMTSHRSYTLPYPIDMSGKT